MSFTFELVLGKLFSGIKKQNIKKDNNVFF